jgi:hypothetical protein
MKTYLSCLTGAAVLAAAGSLSAQFNPGVIGPVVNHWQFNEAANTPLMQTVDSVGSATWIYDIGYNPDTQVQTSFTTGTGAFNVRRTGAGFNINSFAGLSSGTATAPSLFLVANVGWDYTDSASAADFRIGFHNATAGVNITSPTNVERVEILSEIVIRRDGDNVRIGGWAYNPDGTANATASTNVGGAGYATIGGRVETDVRLVLELNQTTNRGAIHYSTDGGVTFTTLGGVTNTFAIASTWDANHVRLGALNNFVSGSGEGFFINDLAIAIPEPSTYAMIFGFVALGAAFVYRRRKNRA